VLVYVRLTKAEQAALSELAAVNRRRIADEAGLAVAQHLHRHGLPVPSLLKCNDQESRLAIATDVQDGPNGRA